MRRPLETAFPTAANASKSSCFASGSMRLLIGSS